MYTLRDAIGDPIGAGHSLTNGSTSRLDRSVDLIVEILKAPSATDTLNLTLLTAISDWLQAQWLAERARPTENGAAVAYAGPFSMASADDRGSKAIMTHHGERPARPFFGSA